MDAGTEIILAKVFVSHIESQPPERIRHEEIGVEDRLDRHKKQVATWVLVA